jgi:hypothetical protein
VVISVECEEVFLFKDRKRLFSTRARSLDTDTAIKDRTFFLCSTHARTRTPYVCPSLGISLANLKMELVHTETVVTKVSTYWRCTSGVVYMHMISVNAALVMAQPLPNTRAWNSCAGNMPSKYVNMDLGHRAPLTQTSQYLWRPTIRGYNVYIRGNSF